MNILLKRTSLAAVAGAIVLVAGPGQASAQMINPGFRVSPRISLQQAAINQGFTGQTFPGLSGFSSFPYANPLINPYANPILNPFANPALNPALNPNAINNYLNTPLSNPYLNPYTNPLTSPLANPYAGTGGTLAGAGYLPANPGYDTAAAAASAAYSPYAGYGESPVGGYLRGTADIIGAQGRWYKDLQQSGIIKEQSRQAHVDTRRKIFDQYLYEREKTPTFEEERQRFLQQDLIRSLNNPPAYEVWSGQALNNVLADLARVDDKKLGSKVPAITLDQDVLKHINLTSGGGNAGLLKNEGQLTWPLALRSDEYKNDRELLNSLAPEAIHQAVNGKVDAGGLKEMNNAIQRIRQKLSASIRDLTPNQYADSNRFLGYFDDSLRVLERPDAGDYFSPKGYVAKGNSVAELLRFMNSKGLTFAPAVPGDEAAYQAVHRALVAYDSAAKAQLAAVKE